MDISKAIKKISLERREILVAAFQNIKPGGFLQTLLDQCDLDSAMKATGFNDTRAKFESDLKDIRKQTSLENQTECEDRVAAFLVFLPREARPDKSDNFVGLDNFLQVVDVSAAVRASSKAYPEDWFKRYTKNTIKDVIAKATIDLVDDNDSVVNNTTPSVRDRAEQKNGKQEREDDDNEAATVKTGGKSKEHKSLSVPVSQKQHHREGPETTTESLLPPSLASPTSDRHPDQRQHISPNDDEDEAGRFDQAVDRGKATEDNNKSKRVTSVEKDKTHFNSHKDNEELDQSVHQTPGAWVWNSDDINDGPIPASRGQRGKRNQEDFAGGAENCTGAGGSKRPRTDNNKPTDERSATPVAPMPTSGPSQILADDDSTGSASSNALVGKLSAWTRKVARIFTKQHEKA